jgi:hypothetical protein
MANIDKWTQVQTFSASLVANTTTSLIHSILDSAIKVRKGVAKIGSSLFFLACVFCNCIPGERINIPGWTAVVPDSASPENLAALQFVSDTIGEVRTRDLQPLLFLLLIPQTALQDGNTSTVSLLTLVGYTGGTPASTDTVKTYLYRASAQAALQRIELHPDWASASLAEKKELLREAANREPEPTADSVGAADTTFYWAKRAWDQAGLVSRIY